MNLIARLIGARRANLVTLRERQRLAATMPGQTGALAASRHGIFV